MNPALIVVTGASGFTGRFVITELVRRFPDARIRCFVRPTSKIEALRNLPVEISLGDLRDKASMGRAFSGADTLVNVASLGFDWIDPLFEAIRSSALSRGVFLSTTAILTRLPVRSKAIRERGESLAKTSGLAWTILRPTMIYGTPDDRNIARLVRLVQKSPLVPVVAPSARQQPVHVGDVAQAVAAALGSEQTIGRTYNLAGREPQSMEELVRTVIRAVGAHRLVVKVPVGPIRALVRAYNAISSAPRIKVEQIDRLNEDKSFDYQEAAKDFAFSPRSFDSGVYAEVEMVRSGEWTCADVIAGIEQTVNR